MAASKKFEIADTDDNETAARVTVSGAALVDTASRLGRLHRQRWNTSQLARDLNRPRLTIQGLVGSYGAGQRTDLDVNDPWQPAVPNSPTLDGYEGTISNT